MGIPPEDFILKPILVEELLDWIGRALALEWWSAPRPRSEPPPPPRRCAYLPAHWLRQLDEGVNLLYAASAARWTNWPAKPRIVKNSSVSPASMSATSGWTR